MAWFETITGALPSVVVSCLRTLLIVLITAALIWGIRPAAQYLLGRVAPRWSGMGATIVQLLLILGGATLIFITAGLEALLAVIVLSLTFGAGLLVGGETLLSDLIATRHIHAHNLYQVNDCVTVGDRIHGIVTAISRTQTRLACPDQAKAIVPNSIIVRNPIVVHNDAVYGQRDDIQVVLAEESQNLTEVGIASDSSTTISNDQALVPDHGDHAVPVVVAPQRSLEPATSVPMHQNPQLDHDAETTTAGTQLTDLSQSQPPHWSKTIRSAVAAPLARRQAPGKWTVRDLH